MAKLTILPRPPAVASRKVASISSDASGSRPRQAASVISVYAERWVPGRLGDQAILVEQPRRRGQLAGEQVGCGEGVERVLQLDERAGVAGEPCLGE